MKDLLRVFACYLFACTALAADPLPLAQRAATLLEQRCMVCHGCYDAPCQLKLEARAGLERGASKTRVYDASRLIEAPMSRLFIDAQSVEKWREKGFYPVLDEDDPEQGLVYRMLALKQAHPLPVSGAMPEGFDFSLDREQQCAKPEEFDEFSEQYPLWGMPFGLPGLGPEEHAVLTDWLQAGAPAVTAPPLKEGERAALQEWEQFLNGGDNKQRLMARYIFEHLFLADIYFGAEDHPAWFRMVRSTTPPGEPVKVIASRRPFDDPGKGHFYYRLMRLEKQPLQKNHMPYRLDEARMARYRELFLAPDYTVESLPGYSLDVASNPFRSFEAIPLNSRYNFLLDEAQFTIMNFIKGPVCRGSVALNVIDDRFWVMFVDPELIDNEPDAAFLSREAGKMRLPTAKTGTAIDILTWHRYARDAEKYRIKRAKYLERKLNSENRSLKATDIWDGDGHNPNAALTVMRHFDSASVVQGFVGSVPKTAWVVAYPLLERIHYLLVANYDVYGSVSHQLESRLYMDFLRLEGESNFLAFMPRDKRSEIWRYWYRDAPDTVVEYFRELEKTFSADSGFSYTTETPMAEFLHFQQERIFAASAQRWDYHGKVSTELAEMLDALQSHIGAHNSFFPQATFLNVIGPQSDRVFTLIRDSGYSNIAQLFEEHERRLPGEDVMTVVDGFLGAYPNYFLVVHEKEMPAFVRSVAGLKSAADYETLVKRWGVQRTDPWFWYVSDKFHAMLAEQRPLDGGLLDYNRYRVMGIPADRAPQ
ncbi:fatty acid cis/trans isomerase [Haliea sp. E17]